MIKFVKYLTAVALMASMSVVAGEEKASQCSNTKQLTLKIDSAACAATCAELDKVLTSLKGVKAESCSQSHLTKVTYDSSKVKSDQLSVSPIAGVSVGIGYDRESTTYIDKKGRRIQKEVSPLL